MTCGPFYGRPIDGLALPSCLGMKSQATYPVALEAVLGAEVALLSKLLAVWALERACVVLTVFAHALSRGVSGHGGWKGGEGRRKNDSMLAMVVCGTTPAFMCASGLTSWAAKLRTPGKKAVVGNFFAAKPILQVGISELDGLGPNEAGADHGLARSFPRAPLPFSMPSFEPLLITLRFASSLSPRQLDYLRRYGHRLIQPCYRPRTSFILYLPRSLHDCRALYASLVNTFLSVPFHFTNMPEKVVVVGAGPVGSLAALYAATRGHQVEIYELRQGTLLAPYPCLGRAHIPKTSEIRTRYLSTLPNPSTLHFRRGE